MKLIGGTVELDTEPSAAAVFVDGQRVGTAPVVVDAIDVGHHVLRVERYGFTPDERTITVADGETVRLRMTLTPARSAAASLLVSALGYEGVGAV